MAWEHLGGINAHSYTCGYCGRDVGPDRGYPAGLTDEAIESTSAHSAAVRLTSNQTTRSTPESHTERRWNTCRRAFSDSTANHEIPDIDRTDAEDVLSFTEMLLKVNYEMPARAEPPSDGSDLDEGVESP